MKLKDFVSDTLVEIMEGVATAHDRWSNSGQKGHINPVWGGYEEAHKAIKDVTFDVAVTVEETSSGEVGGGIRVLGIGNAEGRGSKATQNSRVSRISFSIPISPTIVFLETDSSSAPPP